MDGRGPPTELHVLNAYNCRANECPPQELEVEGYCVWLIVGREGRIEVQLHGGKDDACHETAVGNGANGPRTVEKGGVGPGVDCFDRCRFCEGCHWEECRQQRVMEFLRMLGA